MQYYVLYFNKFKIYFIKCPFINYKVILKMLNIQWSAVLTVNLNKCLKDILCLEFVKKTRYNVLFLCGVYVIIV